MSNLLVLALGVLSVAICQASLASIATGASFDTSVRLDDEGRVHHAAAQQDATASGRSAVLIDESGATEWRKPVVRRQPHLKMGRLEVDETFAEFHAEQEAKKENLSLRASGKRRQFSGNETSNATEAEPEGTNATEPEPEAAGAITGHLHESEDSNETSPEETETPLGHGTPTVAPEVKEVHAPTDRVPPVEEDDGVDPALVKDGWCDPFIEGSLIRGTGEDVTKWKDLTRGECWSKCNLDPACEQAIYEIDDSNGDTHCFIGTGFMMVATPTLSHRCETCKDACYAKNGFGFERARHVKPGFCSEFVEGYAKGMVRQCDLHSTSTEEQTHCSHWGQEYDLSEIGCWTKCESTASCHQAIYDNATANCWIGTSNMTQNPGPNQCPTCINSCYAKHGFP